jgi:hypothetical protein
MKKLLKDARENSTIHSVFKISKANNKFMKIIWIISSITSTTFCSYLIFKGITDYLSYDVVTKIRMIKENESEFPTITFCTNEALVTERGRDIYNKILIQNNFSSIDDSKIDFSTKKELIYSFILNQMNVNYSDAEKKRWGYSKDEMIPNCLYNFDTICSEDQFISFFHFWYGNCLRFNSGINSTGHSVAIKHSKASGFLIGLNVDVITVLLNESKRLDYSNSNEKSVIIFIGNKSFIQSHREALNVPSKSVSYVAIKRTFIKKKGKPYSNCLEDLNQSDSVFYKYISKQTNRTYRQMDCLELIRQENIIKKCNCAISFFPKIDPKTRDCITADDQMCSFKEYFYENLSRESNIYDLCPLECESIEYDFTITTVPITYKDDFIQTRKDNNHKIFQNLTDEQYMSMIAKIFIYYKDIGYEEIVELPNYTWITLISNIGGAFGCFLGMSILSLVEIVELIIGLIFYKKDYVPRLVYV